MNEWDSREIATFIGMLITFLAMALGALWFAWGLIRMQLPALQWRYFAAMALLVLVAGGCIAYFVAQPPENEEVAAIVVLGVMGLTAAGLIGYAVYLRRRFADKLVRWEFTESGSSNVVVPDDDSQDGRE